MSFTERTYIALDLETTGLNPDTDAIIEVGAVKFRDSVIVDVFESLVNPHRPVPYNIQKLCKIRQEDVDSAPAFDELAQELYDFIGDFPIIGHNISFDLGFLAKKGIGIGNRTCDTYELAKLLLPDTPDRTLSGVAESLGIGYSSVHRARADAEMSRGVFSALVKRLYELDPSVLTDLVELTRRTSWWLGDFIADVAWERGADTLLDGSKLEELCLVKTTSKQEPLVPGDELSPIDADDLTKHFGAGGALSRAFSDYEERPQQVAMMRAVAEALNKGQRLIVEAGTGTGKSIAYLLPSLFFALKNNVPVVISTNAINLQEQLVEKDIPDLLSAFDDGHPVKGVNIARLKGRNNYLCLRRWEAQRRVAGLPLEAIQLLARILVWLPSTNTGDRAELNIDSREASYWYRVCAQGYDCMGKRCPYQQRGLCFLFRARKAAENAHLIVVNHALLLSGMASGSQIIPEYHHLIIDEAHHLEVVATEQLGFEIRERDLFDHLDQVYQERDGVVSGIGTQSEHIMRNMDGEQRDALKRLSDSLAASVIKARGRLPEFLNELGSLVESFSRGQGDYDMTLRITNAIRAQPVWSDIEICCENLVGSLGDVVRHLEEMIKIMEENPAAEDLILEIVTIINVNEEFCRQLDSMIFHPEENSIKWLALGRRNNMISLHSAPLNVGSLLEDALYDPKRALILTGASLSTGGNFEYIKDRLGLREVEELLLDSPFDYESAAFVYVVADIPEPGSAGYQDSLERTLISLCRAAQGSTLVLFTSHSAIQAVRVAIEEPLKEDDILVLAQGVDGSPGKLLTMFKQNHRTVLLGAASFWEGIDVVGNALSILVIVRLPFNVPSEPVFSARSETFDDPFNEYALPQAALRFKQGFGRLIRTKDDRGMMVVLDSRISNKSYGSYFLKSLPDCRVEKGNFRDLPGSVRDWLEADGTGKAGCD